MHLDWNEPREVLLDRRVDAAVIRLPIRTDGLHVTIQALITGPDPATR